MSRKANALLKRALTLPVDERAELAGSLIESLDKSKDKTVRAAWESEIARRVDELNSGQVKAIPLEQALRRLASTR